MSSSKDFRMLLFDLSQDLSKHEIEGIIAIEELPADTHEQSALRVLLKLEMLGKIDAAKPSTLEAVLKNVGRMDLAKKVEKFAKQKKSKKSSPRPDEALELNLRANLEVTLVQMRILHEQLMHLQKTAERTALPNHDIRRHISEAREGAQVVDRKLSYVKELLHGKEDLGSPETEATFLPSLHQRNSPFKRELQQSLANSMKTHQRSPQASPKHSMREHATPNTANRAVISQPESEYAEVGRHTLYHTKGNSMLGEFSSTAPVQSPRRQSNDSAGGSALVTGTSSGKSAAGTTKKKPLLPPKPARLQRTEEKECTVSDDEDDNTGTGTTGDSGFADPMPYLKVPLKRPSQLPSRMDNDAMTLPSVGDALSWSTDDTLQLDTDNTQEPSPSYYKAICREEVSAVSYYKQAREMHRRCQELLEQDEPKTRVEKSRESSSSHNTF